MGTLNCCSKPEEKIIEIKEEEKDDDDFPHDTKIERIEEGNILQESGETNQELNQQENNPVILSPNTENENDSPKENQIPNQNEKEETQDINIINSAVQEEHEEKQNNEGEPENNINQQENQDNNQNTNTNNYEQNAELDYATSGQGIQDVNKINYMPYVDGNQNEIQTGTDDLNQYFQGENKYTNLNLDLNNLVFSSESNNENVNNYLEGTNFTFNNNGNMILGNSQTTTDVFTDNNQATNYNIYGTNNFANVNAISGQPHSYNYTFGS